MPPCHCHATTAPLIGWSNTSAMSAAGAALTLSDTDRVRIDEAMEGAVAVGGPSPEAMP